MSKTLVCAIYYHPEAYPSTLNAMDQLSKVYDQIYLLYQPHLKDQWTYPSNVSLVKNGRYFTVEEQSNFSFFKKIVVFLIFTLSFLKLCIRHKPHTVLVYDPIPLLSFHLIKRFFKSPKIVWYHNHDIHRPRKYSIGWFANVIESRAFGYVDIFSLPSEVRKQYFNLNRFRGQYFFLPNYPSKLFYEKFYEPKTLAGPFEVLYQGSIGAGHGIEEVITALSLDSQRGFNLTLIGKISETYKKQLQKFINILDVNDRVQILPAVNYGDLPCITSKCHIGLAIHLPVNINFATAGTASNKIYEYAALGLPILYSDSKHYKEHLGGLNWAVACNTNPDQILLSLKCIAQNYGELSNQARVDFGNKFNFENNFSLVVKLLN